MRTEILKVFLHPHLIDLISAYEDILAAFTAEVEIANYTYGLTRLHEQGIVIGDYKYDAFGVLDAGHNSFDNTSPHAINFAYTGYPAEPTGLYFANARYYAPEIGQFISEDTYEGEMRNPLSLNRYVYVYNNPQNYYDPTGNDAVIITAKWGAYGGGHTSLLLQNEDGDWFYTFYGDKKVVSVQVDSRVME